MKLGRVKRTQPHGLLRLSMFGGGLPPAREGTDWTLGIPDGDGWGMAGNDMAGDCALAAVGHMNLCAERWRDGTARAVGTEETLDNYRLFGYAPPESDPGTEISAMLRLWATQGLKWQGQELKIEAAAEVTFGELCASVDLFGPVIGGFDMPRAAAEQSVFTTPSETTSDTNAPGGWGGHCMLIVAHSPGFVKVVTWGKVMLAEIGWVQAYMDEAWAVVHPVWMAGPHAPNGRLVGELRAYMQLLLGTGPVASMLG